MQIVSLRDDLNEISRTILSVCHGEKMPEIWAEIGRIIPGLEFDKKKNNNKKQTLLPYLL